MIKNTMDTVSVANMDTVSIANMDTVSIANMGVCYKFCEFSKSNR